MRLRVRCPKCRTEVAWDDSPFRPFCSARCRALDQGAWLTEDYRIPGETVGDTEAEAEALTPDPDQRKH
jgi:endogenous inhibitor of DNA gyrase (YacG/DUF329 family)